MYSLNLPFDETVYVCSHRWVSAPALVSANKPPCFTFSFHLLITTDTAADCCIVHYIKDSTDFLNLSSACQMSISKMHITGTAVASAGSNCLNVSVPVKEILFASVTISSSPE